MRKLLLILLLIFPFHGALAEYEDIVAGLRNFQSEKPIPDGHARIKIYRVKTYHASMRKARVFINGRNMVDLRQKEQFIVDHPVSNIDNISIGLSLIGVVPDFYPLDAKEGYEYIIFIKGAWNLKRGYFEYSLVDERESEDYKKRKLAKEEAERIEQAKREKEARKKAEEERIAEAKRKEEEKREAEARKQKEEEKQIAESKNKEENYNRKTKPEKKREYYDSQKDVLVDLSKFHSYGVGTGFFINKKGDIVTNNHVGGTRCGMRVAKVKGKYYVLNLMAYDEKNDLAVLGSNLKPKDFFSISNEDVDLTEKIFAVGFPFGDKVTSTIKTTSGVVSSLAGIGDNYSQMQIDAAVQQGNSGGAVINEDGVAVGVVVEEANWKYFVEELDSLPENINFAIKSSTLVTFLKANDIEFKKSNLLSKMTSTKQLSKKAQNSSLFLICAITKDTHDAMDDRNKASLVDYKF